MSRQLLTLLGLTCLLGCEAAPLDVIHERAQSPVPTEPPHYGTPVRIEALALAGPDDDPTFTADRLELYFSSNRSGGEDIWRSTRVSVDEPWGTPSLVNELNGEFIDATPGIAPDGLTIWFESTRRATDQDLTSTDIFVSQRSARDAVWSEPTLVSELSTAGRDSAPMPSSSLLLSFSSWRDGGVGDTDIYATLRTSASSPWGPASLLAEASSDSWDQGLLRGDGSQLFISSGRSSELGGGNLFWSARSSLSSSFGAPVLLTDLCTDADEQDIWVSETLDYVVFASDRDGDLDLYEASGQP